MPTVVCCETTELVNGEEAVALLGEQRQRVVEAGMAGLNVGIVYGPAGNLSEVERSQGVVAIAPIGIP